MIKEVYKTDGGALVKAMNERQATIRTMISATAREQARRLIGRAVKFGNKARPKTNGVFRAWALSDNADNAPAKALIDKKNGGSKLTIGLQQFNARGGEKWLESIERGGKFRASPALVEYRANELANKYLKLKRFI